MQLQEVNLNLATHLISNIAIRILKETNIVQLVEDGKTTATEAEVEEVQAAVVVVAMAAVATAAVVAGKHDCEGRRSRRPCFPSGIAPPLPGISYSVLSAFS